MSVDSSPKTVPDGWKTATIGEVCKVVSGSTPKTNVSDYWGGDIPWLTPNDLSKNRSKVVITGERSITKKGFDSCSTQMVPEGSVLFTSRAPIGYVAIAGTPMCTNQGFKSAVPSENIGTEFLYWQLQNLTDDIRSRASGTTFLEISGKGFAATNLVVPPLQEQEKIVEILEEQLVRLDAALASVRLVREKAVRFRRSLLHAAFTGALTDHDTLMGTLPEGWRQLTLNEACELITDGSHFSPATVESGMPYITVRDLGESGIDFLNCKFITRESFSELARNGCQPLKNDVLFSKDGTVGKVALVNDEREFVVLSSLAIVRPSKDVISSSFLKLSMQSPSFLETALGLKTGTALRRIVLRNLKTVKMAVPPLKEQEKIVGILEEQLSRLGAALSVADAIERKTSAARRSLLHAAFTGNLTKEWRECAHV